MENAETPRISEEEESKETLKKIPTGLAGLDKLLAGGFPQNTVILLSGCAGTGKTLWGLNFLVDGVTKDERVCYISLNENKEELLKASRQIAQLSALERSLGKNFIIERIILGGKINLEYFTKMFSDYPKIDRLVIDNVNKLLIFAENKRDYRLHLAELVRYLKEKVACTILICETEKDNIDSGNGEAFESDGVVHLAFSELEEKPLRILSLHKMRYTPIEPHVRHGFVIDAKGLRLSGAKLI